MLISFHVTFLGKDVKVWSTFFYVERAC